MPDFPPLEEAVARLVVDLEYESLPPEALAGARRLLQDQLALQVGCAGLPWSQTVVELTRNRHVPGTSRVALSGDPMSAADAAFVNATLGHSFEYDDAHSASLSHPGSCVIPAALAIGEETGATMREIMEGVVAGYEVYTRIGTLASPQLLGRGFHPHAILAPFGAAAVAAKMLGFNVETTIHALAIAFSHSSGTTEYTSSGGSVKRLHSGIGTRDGIRAAEMADAGITGPIAFLTGGKGLYNTFVVRDVSVRDAALFGRDRPFEIAHPLIKPYCCCGYNHAFVDGARHFAHRVGEIEHVELGIQTSGDVVVGNRNSNAFAPQQIEHLQYSLPFQFAFSVLGQGNGFESHRAYLDGQLNIGDHSAPAEFARRVSIHADTELDRRYPRKMVADITVTFRDGLTEHLFVEDSVGSADNPMSQSDLDAKFRDLTDSAIGSEQSERLLQTIVTGDPTLTARELVNLLVLEPTLVH